MRAKLLTTTIADLGEACDRYEGRKRQYLNIGILCFAASIAVIPMVLEATGGARGREARRAFTVAVQLAADATGEEAASVADRMAQQYSIPFTGRMRGPWASAARLAAAGAVAAAQVD